MNAIDYDREFSQLLDQMARDMALSNELPNMYGDNFRKAVANRLRREKKQSAYTYGYSQFNCLLDKSRRTNDLLELVAKYLQYNEEEEDEKKNSLALKIADTLTDNALIFHREEIEDIVKDKFEKSYVPDYLTAAHFPTILNTFHPIGA